MKRSLKILAIVGVIILLFQYQSLLGSYLIGLKPLLPQWVQSMFFSGNQQAEIIPQALRKMTENLSSISPGQGIINLPKPKTPAAKATLEDIRAVERQMVDLINKDRSQHGAPPVTWDETAARAARQHVQEEADYGYISHWGLDGAKPQLRYTKAGGQDAVEENESVTLWEEGGFTGVSKEELYRIVAEHEKAMVNEQPPNDGHRRNILDPHHTGVGIAIAVGKNGVAMAQEFTNHYGTFSLVPVQAAPGTKATLTGRIQPGYKLLAVYATWEQLPQPMTREQLLQTHSYSDPPEENLHFWAKPQGNGYYIQTVGGKLFAKNIVVDYQGNFSLSIPLYNRRSLDYVAVEIAPNNNLEDRFYAAQFVVSLTQ